MPVFSEFAIIPPVMTRIETGPAPIQLVLRESSTVIVLQGNGRPRFPVARETGDVTSVRFDIIADLASSTQKGITWDELVTHGDLKDLAAAVRQMTDEQFANFPLQAHSILSELSWEGAKMGSMANAATTLHANLVTFAEEIRTQPETGRLKKP